MYRFTSFILAMVMMAALPFASCNNKQKNERDDQSADKAVAKNDLPEMPFFTVDGNILNAKRLDGNLVIVLFQPDCDHCQREAQEIEAHKEAFSNYQVYFVSPDPFPHLEKFAKDYKLNALPNFHFVRTDTDAIIKNFGAISAPSLYIYADGQLKRGFNGETPIDQIVGAL